LGVPIDEPERAAATTSAPGSLLIKASTADASRIVMVGGQRKAASTASVGSRPRCHSFGRGRAPLSQQFVDQGPRSRHGVSERSQFPDRVLRSLQHDVISVEPNAQVIARFQSESGPQISRYHQPPLLSENDRGMHEISVAQAPPVWHKR
jgi:hypothetical protein